MFALNRLKYELLCEIRDAFASEFNSKRFAALIHENLPMNAGRRIRRSHRFSKIGLKRIGHDSATFDVFCHSRAYPVEVEVKFPQGREIEIIIDEAVLKTRVYQREFGATRFKFSGLNKASPHFIRRPMQFKFS